MAMGKVAWKIMGTGGAILAGVIATKVIDAIWAKTGVTRSTRRTRNAPLAKAVAYAAITGLAVGAAKTIATRKAARSTRSRPATCPRRSARTPSDLAPSRVENTPCGPMAARRVLYSRPVRRRSTSRP